MIAGLRAIYSAQQTFASFCGAGAYAATLDGLRTPPPGGGSSGFIGPSVGTATLRYTLSLEGVGQWLGSASCNGAALASGYFAHAEPFGADLPSFALDQHGTIFRRRDGRRISPSFDGAERLK